MAGGCRIDEDDSVVLLGQEGLPVKCRPVGVGLADIVLALWPAQPLFEGWIGAPVS